MATDGASGAAWDGREPGRGCRKDQRGRGQVPRARPAPADPSMGFTPAPNPLGARKQALSGAGAVEPPGGPSIPSRSRSALSIVLLVLLAGAGSWPSFASALPPATGCLPHPPIAIDGDSGIVLGVLPTGQPVYRPGSGVSAGHGTPESPFVIEGLCLYGGPSPEPGIRVRGTTAHLVVRDVDVANVTRRIEVEDASNVTFERVRGLRTLYVDDAADVRLRQTELSRLSGSRVAGLVVEDSVFASGEYAVDLYRATGGAIARNVFHRSTYPLVVGSSWDVRISSNTFLDPVQPLRTYGGGRNLIEENVFVGADGPLLIGGTGQILRSNRVDGMGIRLAGTEAVLEGNVMIGGGLWMPLKDLPSRLHRITPDNTENGLPIRYLRNADGAVVDGGPGRVIVVASSGVHILNQSQSVEISHSSGALVSGSTGPIYLLWTQGSVVRGNTLAGATLEIEASSSNTIERNTFLGSSYCVDLYGSPSNTFRDNRFEGCGLGLRIENARLNVIENNRFANGTGTAIDSYSRGLGNDGTVIRSNVLTGNALGVRVYVTPIVVETNNIHGNGVGVRMDSTVELKAKENWWGCAAGPGSAGCDVVAGPVVTTPVSTAPHATAGPR